MGAPPQESRKRIRMDYDERRQLILVTARRLFSERPYSEISMAELADAAGVARGLLHHYFGSKRDLYPEVVRDVVRVPAIPVPDQVSALSVGQMWERSVDGWLTLIENNRALWLAAMRVGGSGRDAEVETILDAAKEVVVEQTLQAAGVDRESAPPELRALVRGFGGMVQEITLEWLQRERLTREQARTVLLRTLPLLLERVAPALLAPAASDARGDRA